MFLPTINTVSSLRFRYCVLLFAHFLLPRLHELIPRGHPAVAVRLVGGFLREGLQRCRRIRRGRKSRPAPLPEFPLLGSLVEELQRVHEVLTTADAVVVALGRGPVRLLVDALR